LSYEYYEIEISVLPFFDDGGGPDGGPPGPSLAFDGGGPDGAPDGELGGDAPDPGGPPLGGPPFGAPVVLPGGGGESAPERT